MMQSRKAPAASNTPAAGRAATFLLAGLAAAFCFCACQQRRSIAVIPWTEGNTVWDALHTGAEFSANQLNESLYWIAPTREDDVERQIALIERVVDGRYRGLVLAPDRVLPLITPVRRAVERGIPTVVLASPLPIAAGPHLRYVLNDDQAGGQMAAQRIAKILNGRGNVALLGINPDIASITIRSRAFEELLARDYPNIHIVDRSFGSVSIPREQQVAEETLRRHPDLNAVVALMWQSSGATLLALDTVRTHGAVAVIGFDSQGWPPPFAGKPSLDSVIQQNTRAMGEKAIDCIHRMNTGQDSPATQYLKPILVTRENVNSPEIATLFTQNWKFGKWRWSAAQ